MDPISAALVTFGVLLLLISWIYLMFISFEADFSWGLCTVFVPPLSYIYACFTWSKTKAALWMAILGWVLIIIGW
jgi:hypothetical protein